ncbi:uncharacterized protein EAE97_007178 [Botrytis byssoidea]|uniref:Uncharacterized protein n=1 Tax=Botrytis byssoidea TaxID=139641 RepID=A0A9P5IH07_9HELO|nr:uncharacterized protein EAE97_007178 [Botrytis byssoidea]KAF7939097.1 hypothetical protein EAE97_007178 [Botrytis byssoidea]
MSFNGRGSSSHKEPQPDGSQVEDTKPDQASSGPSVMMGEEPKEKTLTEERKHRQGFYNRDRRMYGVQRTFGFWEPAGREGAEQDAANKDESNSDWISTSEWDSDAPYPPPQIKNCNLRDYNIPVNDKTPMDNLSLEQFILTETENILTSSCISWLRKHHPALVAREGWGNGKKGSLEVKQPE